ncbi:MAG: ABC-F family ATP-binding cassette domain-containing protein [Bacteroidota bacterium]
MLAVNQISVLFAGNELFSNVSFLVNPRDRIGLVGKNGAGKSTLLKIIAGKQSTDAGNISMPKECTIGYLPQEMKVNNGNTVVVETSLTFEEIKNLEKQLIEINTKIAESVDYESADYLKLLDKLHDVEERYKIIGGYSYQAEIELVLKGLGFDQKDFDKKTDEFSGGWRMRIELAKILLKKPTVLLLDEPTNHLDIESIQWLEDFLKNYPGAIILVSHDRLFLDNITNRTIEITGGKIYDVKGNYSKYVSLREERLEQQLNELKNQEKFIEHTETLINKFRAKKNKAAFAQSLIKKLDRLERVEVDDIENASINFQFPAAERSGKVVVEVQDTEKKYAEKLIFSHVNLEILREEKIAFVGKNGQGKTTLSKIIAGIEPCSSGEIKLGHNVSLGYYAQNQAEFLNENKTVFETIDEVAVGDVRKNIRGLLGSFLFSGDTVDKKVKVLSGGEKSRLALCKLMLQPYNLLVLDEPTNHLDMASKEMLKDALLEYTGTMIVVSHDRDFLQGLTQKVVEFKDGSIKEYIGDISYFLEQRKLNQLNELNQLSQQSKQQEKVVTENKLSYEQKKEQDKEQRKIANQISKCEKEIEELENKIAKLDEELANPETSTKVSADPTFFANYNNIKKQIELKMTEWESLQQ